MSVNEMLMAAAGAGGAPEYVEDVFSTYLYTGNDSTQTINNGIDLAGKGGLVWLKGRNGSNPAYTDHALSDTTMTKLAGSYYPYLVTSTSAAISSSYGDITSFNSNGFSLGWGGSNSNTSSTYNTGGGGYVAWTFRKAPKFFDVVTFTPGSSNTNYRVSHSLGSVPGMIIVKNLTTQDWFVWHRSLTNQITSGIKLNATDVPFDLTNFWGTSAPTSTDFGINTSWFGAGSSVAYLFAHNAGGFGDTGTDNIISCGSYTGNGSATGPTVTLNYEPQWLLIRRTDSTGDWNLIDNMRGFVVGGTDAELNPNLSAAESTGTFVTPTATGFQLNTTDAGYNANNGTYIYMAIRRPMKKPTSGSEVFSPTVYTGTNADNRLINTGIITDMVMIKERNDTVAGMVTGDRLRGNPYLLTGTTAAEVNDADSLMTPTASYGNAFSAMNGVGVGNDATSKVNIDTTSNNHIAWAFKRAKSFFDVVCYTGTGSATTVTHNLGVVPELMIVKRRSAAADWSVYASVLGNDKYLSLNDIIASSTTSSYWNSTTPTSTVFTVGVGNQTNGSGSTYVAYLFASVAGVSKVGSYTGNGTNQTINCGFSAGARFVLIKRTDSTGDWCVFDTARGIVSGNDPFAQLNVAAGEVTGEDAVDPDNSGFIVNETTEALNTNNATYIYLAIA